jgi:hypothetical protein
VVNGDVPVSRSAGMNVPPEGLLPTTPVLTIEEAAGVLRISRTLAYELATQYRKSGGTSGLPCTRIAGCLRVPRWALLKLALTGQVEPLTDADVWDVIKSHVGSEADHGA